MSRSYESEARGLGMWIEPKPQEIATPVVVTEGHATGSPRRRPRRSRKSPDTPTLSDPAFE